MILTNADPVHWRIYAMLGEMNWEQKFCQALLYIQYVFAHKVQSSKRCIQKISAANIERDSKKKKKKSIYEKAIYS